MGHPVTEKCTTFAPLYPDERFLCTQSHWRIIDHINSVEHGKWPGEEHHFPAKTYLDGKILKPDSIEFERIRKYSCGKPLPECLSLKLHEPVKIAGRNLNFARRLVNGANATVVQIPSGGQWVEIQLLGTQDRAIIKYQRIEIELRDGTTANSGNRLQLCYTSNFTSNYILQQSFYIFFQYYM